MARKPFGFDVPLTTSGYKLGVKIFRKPITHQYELDLRLEQGTVPKGWKVVDSYEGSIGPDPAADSLSARRKLEANNVRLMAIRHGESEVNKLAKEIQQSVFCGSYDSPLTPEGVKQAEEAAGKVYESLGGDEWMAEAVKDPKLLPIIYTSPLSRAQDTALATANHLVNKAFELVKQGKAKQSQAQIVAHAVEPKEADSIRESSFGDYELGLISEVKEAHPEFVENWDGYNGKGVNSLHRFPNGESRSDTLARVDGFLHEVADRHANSTVLMFGHHGSIQAAKTSVGERKIVAGKLTVMAPEIKNAAPIALVW